MAPVGTNPLGPITGTVTDWSPSVREDIDNVYTVKWAEINATASGDTTVVAAVTGRKIRVLSYFIGPVSAAVNIAWKSGAGTTKVNAMTFAINEGMVVPDMSPGWAVETDSGGALVINLSAAANVRGAVNYIEV